MNKPYFFNEHPTRRNVRLMGDKRELPQLEGWVGPVWIEENDYGVLSRIEAIVLAREIAEVVTKHLNKCAALKAARGE